MRPIIVESQQSASSTNQSAKVICLKPDDIQFDYRVQRQLLEKDLVFKRPFDPTLFGLGTVSMRADGTPSSLDGQRRGDYAKRSGYGQHLFPYTAHYGLSVKEEASLFLALQGDRRNVSVTEKFKVGETAEVETIVQIKEVLRKHDISPVAVAALCRVYRDHGVIGLDQTLQVLIDAWG